MRGATCAVDTLFNGANYTEGNAAFLAKRASRCVRRCLPTLCDSPEPRDLPNRRRHGRGKMRRQSAIATNWPRVTEAWEHP
jgi:hypothetical protein